MDDSEAARESSKASSKRHLLYVDLLSADM